MKELIKQISDFTYRNGFEVTRVFDDLLRYIIWLHTLPETPGAVMTDWRYKSKHSKDFFSIYKSLVGVMQKELRKREWFDPFGIIYEELIASKSRRSNSGQFFTPESLCDLMTDITQPGESVSGQRICDCACGSGRTLLAFNARNLGNYYVAEDIDRTCAMMCVCNFILHGMVGEVICHDTLNPDKFYGAWKTNEQLNNPFRQFCGIPHVREISEAETTMKKILDGMTKETDINSRIKKKLIANAERHRARLKEIMSIKPLTSALKAEARHVSKQYNQIKKLIKKYE